MASLRLFALFVSLGACATAGPSQPNTNNDASVNEDASLEVDANNCATQPCDILTQCGCTSNAACDVDGNDLDGPACRAVAANAAGEGGECAGGVTTCQPGTVCIGNLCSVCKKYCDADAECGQPRGKCIIEITDGTNPIPNIPKVCSSNCDPANVNVGGCPTGMKCGFFVAPGNVTIVDCDVAQTGVQGTNCEVGTTNTGNEEICGPGFTCTTLDNNAFNCRKVCNRTANTGCVGAQTCIAFDPALIVAGTEYGVCN
jgi:hypothetical protein